MSVSFNFSNLAYLNELMRYKVRFYFKNVLISSRRWQSREILPRNGRADGILWRYRTEKPGFFQGKLRAHGNFATIFLNHEMNI